MDEAGVGQLLAGHGAAGNRISLEHLDGQPGARQVGGGDQAVVTGADHEHVAGLRHRRATCQTT